MSEPTSPTVYDAEFFLDPACPWCWITSRWVVNVQAERELSVRWRFISLFVVNEHSDSEYAVKHRPGAIATFNLLRMLHEVREREGNDAVGKLYMAIGTELHVHRRYEEAYADIAAFAKECLAAVGLDPEYASHVDEESHDVVIREETDTALERTGGNVGTPTITIGPDTEAPRSFFGPVMPKAPKGDDAVALWNAVATLAHCNVAELKRSSRGDLVFD
jgi:Mycothiol-dependent nitroreductase Rv2466c